MKASALAALLSLAAGLSQACAAESVFSDSLAVKEPSRAPGKQLDGLPVEAGQGAWKATSNFLFAQDGGLAPSAANGAVAKLDLPEGATAIEISVDCSPKTEKQAWIGVGFNGSSNTSETTWAGGVMLILNDRGYCDVFGDGTKHKLMSKKIDSFNAEGMNKVSLRYDCLSNSVWASVNGVEVLSDCGLNAKGYTPSVSNAGVSCYGASQQARLANFSMKVQSDPERAKKQAQSAPSKGDAYRVLFMGDSITCHQPSEKLKWTLTCGMAASAPENDYVHKLCSKLEAELKGRKVEKTILANGGGVVKNYSGRIKEYRDFQPDLVVIQFGENEKNGKDAFVAEYSALLKDVKSLSPAPQIVCVGIWNPANGGTYAGAIAEMESAVAKMAADNGAAYAPVSSWARNSECFGYGENPGVKWHPNDKGMEGYAESIMDAWRKAKRP